MATSVRGSGTQFSLASVGGNWYWTVQTNNIRSGGQFYEVTDIRSPYGALASVNLPIPGDVALAIGASITEIQSQFDPLVALVSGEPSSYTVTVTEGDPSQILGDVEFQNSGAFGSFLTVTATPNVAWLSASPTSVVGLGKNEQGQVGLTLKPATLLSTDSPYTGLLNLQDNRSSPTTIPITVTVTVLPKPTIDLSDTELTLTYTLTSGTPGGSQQLTVTNSGPSDSQLSVTLAKVQNSSAWLQFSPAALGPLDSGESAIATFSLNTANIPQIAGVYTENIKVDASNATNDPQVMTVKLVVSP